MANAKVILNGTTLIDVTQKTVTAGDIVSPKTAIKNDGTEITGSITSKSAQTYTPTTTDQTISAGQYLAGDQTVKGDANLVAANIAEGVTIFGVQGTHSGGGGEVESKDVDFYDYDGTRVYSYTAAEFANLSAMPANPSHDGLTAQGWNWTLSDAKTYVSSYGKLNIGQMYITNDGKTRVYMEIGERKEIPLYFYQSVSGGVEIDWGDNSQVETISGNGNKTPTHTYLNSGKYILTFKVIDGYMTLGIGTNRSLFGYVASAGNIGRVYSNYVKKVEIGENTRCYSNAFCRFTSLETITVPKSMSFGSGAWFLECFSLKYFTFPNENELNTADQFFSCCYSLKRVSFAKKNISDYNSKMFNYCYSLEQLYISDAQTSLGTQWFQYCTALSDVVIPNTITEIKSSAFSNCENLTKITIPASVTTIGNNAFANCYGVKEYHIKATTPPTLGTSVFSNIKSDCVIYVPSASLSTYQGASNWSTYASQMVGE